MQTKDAILAAIDEAYQYFITNDMAPDKHEFIERVCKIMNRGETSTYNYETMIKLVEKFASDKIKSLFEVDEASIEKDSDGYKVSQSPQPSQKSPAQIGYDAVPPQPEEYQERVIQDSDAQQADRMREPEDFNNMRSYGKKQEWIKKEEDNPSKFESTKSMERAIYQIMTDGGMSDKEANDTIDNMSTKDMERYLAEGKNASLKVESLHPKASKLYHATFEPYLDDVKKFGLGGGGKRNYSDSQKGVVYLASDKYEAESYAEVSETVPEDYLDQIVVFEVDIKNLDEDKLSADSNVIDGATTFEYHGVIPFDKLKIVDVKGDIGKEEEIETEADSGQPGDGQFPGQTSDFSNEREGDTHYSYSSKGTEAEVMRVINPEKENVEDWQVLKMIRTMLPFQHSKEEIEGISKQLKIDKEKVNVIVKDLISRHILEQGESGYAVSAAFGSEMAEPSYDPLEI